jgi:hypothetical protein
LRDVLLEQFVGRHAVFGRVPFGRLFLAVLVLIIVFLFFLRRVGQSVQQQHGRHVQAVPRQRVLLAVDIVGKLLFFAGWCVGGGWDGRIRSRQRRVGRWPDAPRSARVGVIEFRRSVGPVRPDRIHGHADTRRRRERQSVRRIPERRGRRLAERRPAG